MQNLKSTPGPWQSFGRMVHIPPEHENKKVGRFICDTVSCDEYEKEDIANARLIAAAPEMLECLINVVDNGVDYVNYGNI